MDFFYKFSRLHHYDWYTMQKLWYDEFFLKIIIVMARLRYLPFTAKIITKPLELPFFTIFILFYFSGRNLSQFFS